MSWTNTELTTSTDLKAYESELNTLIDIAETTHTIENQSISTAEIEGDSIYVSQSKGGSEIIIQAKSDIDASNGLIVKLQESSDNTEWEDVEGQLFSTTDSFSNEDVLVRFPISENSLEYVRIYITSNVGNSGTISAFIEGLYAVKIELTKSILKPRILAFLSSSFREWFEYHKRDGIDPIDMVNNPLIFSEASTLYTLYLIYSDFASGGTSGSYQEKADRYKNQYNVAFATAVNLIDIDLDIDNEVDEYAVKINGKLVI